MAEPILIVQYVACVYGVAAVGICWANNPWKCPAMRCIASDRMVEIMRPRRVENETLCAMTKQFSIVKFIAVLPLLAIHVLVDVRADLLVRLIVHSNGRYICLFH